MTKEINTLFCLLESRLNYKRPNSLTITEMLKSVTNYYKTLNPTNGLTNTKLTFHLQLNENQTTHNAYLKYISSTTNTIFKIYENGTHEINNPSNFLDYYFLADKLGFIQDYFPSSKLKKTNKTTQKTFYHKNDTQKTYTKTKEIIKEPSLPNQDKKFIEKLEKQWEDSREGITYMEVLEIADPKLYNFLKDYTLI